MTSRRPPPHDDPADSAAALSDEAVTPRGGFMARPGLKAPPRHAVVVRGGHAPHSEHIPRFRSSIPPPPSPPSTEPAPPSANEEVTLDAVPTPVSSRVSVPLASARLPVAESVPPPSNVPPSNAPLSDAPFVSSVPDTTNGLELRRAARSRWTIVAAAAAGLVLGLASVAARLYARGVATPPPAAGTPNAVPVTTTSVTQLAPASVSVVPALRAPLATTPQGEAARKPGRPAAPSAKRSIF